MGKINIFDLTVHEVESIVALLSKSAFKPYRYLAKGIEKDIDLFWVNRIANSLQIDRTKAFMAELNNESVGFVCVSDLPWDSAIFGMPMASISEFYVDFGNSAKFEIGQTLMNRAIDWARQNGYRFLLCKTYTDDLNSIHVVEKSGFHLVDTLLDYAIDFRKTPFDILPKPSLLADVRIRFAVPGDLAEIEELAKLSFQSHFGRYHSDPRISREQANKVYVEWMRSSLSGYADYFLLAEIDGRIAGLSIWKKPTENEKDIPVRIGHYSIGAIHPDFFGWHLFTLLTYEGIKLLNGQTDMIDGPTHINNYAVQRGYSRLNWQIFDARHSFHKWLD